MLSKILFCLKQLLPLKYETTSIVTDDSGKNEVWNVSFGGNYSKHDVDSEVSFCPSCGAEGSDANFCMNCGQKL